VGTSVYSRSCRYTEVYLQDRLQSVLNAPGRQNTQLHCYGSFTGCASRSESSSGCVFWHTIVYMAQHSALAYQYDNLRPTSEIVARRCLRSADTTILQVPSTRWATPGDRAFPVAAAWAWNSLPPETRACCSVLTF